MGSRDQSIMDAFLEEKKRNRRASTVTLLLSILVVVGIFWGLRFDVITMTSDDPVYCGIEDHTHTLACFSDTSADLETAADWEASLSGVELSGTWNADLARMAATQIGYAESSSNYEVAEDEQSKNGYSRYGAWFGDPYADWNSIFIAFNLHYAGVAEAYMPFAQDIQTWISQLQDSALYEPAADYDAQVGDIVFFGLGEGSADLNASKGIDHAGIVYRIDTDAAVLHSIEGDSEGQVKENKYDLADARIIGYANLGQAYDTYLMANGLMEAPVLEEESSEEEPAETEEAEEEPDETFEEEPAETEATETELAETEVAEAEATETELAEVTLGNSVTAETATVAPLAAPALLDTADSRADGIKINLFNYELNSESANATTGINSGKDLKFNSNAGTWNNWTGGAHAYQGILKNTLGSDGYPVLNVGSNQSLNYLFDSTVDEQWRSSYLDVNYLFAKDSAGNYSFDSNKHYAYYDPAQDDEGDFRVYDGSYQVREADSNSKVIVGFFPLDDYNDSNIDGPDRHNTLDFGSDHYYNHLFGLTMETDFLLSADGQYKGNDIQFNFAGNDDIWVFIDDVLVLDIGGIHDAMGGSINFATGGVHVNGQTDTTIAKRFEEAGRTWTGANNDITRHKLKLFFLERGANQSNLSMSFNLPTFDGQIEKTDLVVEKVWSDGNENHAAESINFQVLDANKNPVELDGKTAFTLNQGNNWTQTFADLNAGEVSDYTVEEIDPSEAYEVSYESFASKDGDRDVLTHTITNTKEATPRTISVEKKWYRQNGELLTRAPEDNVQVRLMRKSDSPAGSGEEHTVTFQIEGRYDDPDNGIWYELGYHTFDTQTVADGGSIEFAFAAPSGVNGEWHNGFLASVVDSSGSDAEDTGRTYNFGQLNGQEKTVDARVFKLSHITEDITIKMDFFDVWDQNIDYWHFTDAYIQKYYNIENPTPTGTPPATSGEGEAVPGVAVLTLDESNNWSGEWTGLDEGYSYYVEEISIGGSPPSEANYTVSYENNDGIASGSIRVKNTALDDFAYELPETGGSGTAMFTMGGLLLAIAPLVYGYIRRRRKRREVT